jgi:hypothetical protein
MTYCTLADVREYLGISDDHTSDDALISQCILAAKQAVDRYTNRVFDASANSTLMYDGNSDLIRGRTLMLGRYTLASEPTEVLIAETDVTSYVSVANDAPFDMLYIQSSSPKTWSSYDEDPWASISITGKWGYSTTPPDDVVQAAIIWSAWLYQIKDLNPSGVLSQLSGEQQTRASEIPDRAAMMLYPYAVMW